MSLDSDVPAVRIRAGNERDVQKSNAYVLYWMTAFRRTNANFSLQRAVDWARELNRPLLVFEALRSGYQWASDRFHYFVIQGMESNRKNLEKRNAFYYPYLEPEPGAGSGLLEKLAEKACVVISDDFPCFFLPRMTKMVGSRLPVRFELVDSNGTLPMRSADQVFSRAHYFRRFLQKNLRPHLMEFPKDDPLARIKLPMLTQIPRGLKTKWPPADVAKLAANPDLLDNFPIDHEVKVSNIAGGAQAARSQLKRFIEQRLDHYNDLRNHPDEDAGSGLSPYLHFGHISTHQVFRDVMKHVGWSVNDLADKANGSREGWWNASPSGEAFLDELITWREVGYNMCWQREDYDQYDSLPDWAKKTLAEHEKDKREYVYTLEEFENADTHDEIWNAAQRQLVREGRIHNYLRMLWGKKILHWTANARDALAIMIELNNKYAVDGRDPNSYSGIFWILGRYDRAWGPERNIFGKVRYMTSENTARKLRLSGYLEKYGPA